MNIAPENSNDFNAEARRKQSTQRELKLDRVLETSSAAETEVLAQRLARVLVEPVSRMTSAFVIMLSGELGAGKTVFVRGLLRGLGPPAGVVATSPTYVLQHVYRGGSRTLYHLDAYRIAGGPVEFEASGLLECLDDPGALVCVEWPERLGAFAWPAERISAEFEHADAQRRRITLKASGPLASSVLARAESSFDIKHG